MKKTILLGFLLSTTIVAFAQEETVEDVYLKVSAETRIIDSQASSPSRALKSMAIQDLTAMNEEGRLNGSDPFVMGIITQLGSEGTGIISTENGRIVNNFPTIRREAAELLGNINTVQSANALVELGEMETESMVLSEIIVGISKNTAAEPKLVVDTVSRLMEVHGSVKDHNFGIAFLNAVANIASNGIEIENEKIYEQVAQMTQPDSTYIKIVQERAKEVRQILMGINK